MADLKDEEEKGDERDKEDKGDKGDEGDEGEITNTKHQMPNTELQLWSDSNELSPTFYVW